MLVAFDIVTILACFYISFFLTIKIFYKNIFWGNFSNLALASFSIVALVVVFLFIFQTYKVVWHFAKPGHYFKMVAAIVCSILLFGILDSTWWKLLSRAFYDFTQNQIAYITTFPVYCFPQLLLLFFFVLAIKH